MRKTSIIFIFLMGIHLIPLLRTGGIGVSLWAQVPIERPNLQRPTLVSPYYFGPNAFPVPDMLDGHTSSTLRIEGAGDYFIGYQKDWTANAFLRVCVPLFTNRVNLTVWLPVQEWYGYSNQRMQTCRVQDTTMVRGHGAGDAYVSTDIQLWRESHYAPGITLRAAIKSASGGQFEQARFYDSPGYWFDLSLGKSFFFGRQSYLPVEVIRDKENRTAIRADWNRYYSQAPQGREVMLRFAASAGFLCWQTDNGRQNDAVMYGLQMLLRTAHFSLTETWQGYTGWESTANRTDLRPTGDCPMVLKTRLAAHAKGFEPYVLYEWGIRDYPFHHLRLGMVYNFAILK